jgi:hypothetical protein
MLRYLLGKSGVELSLKDIGGEFDFVYSSLQQGGQ